MIIGLRFVFILVVFFVVSCASTSVKKSSNKELSLEVSGITIKPHQVIPINYLLEHPEQKGLLIAHYLGTGKTFLALAAAELLDNQAVYVVVPDFLRASWVSHMKRMSLKNPKRYHVLSYEEAANSLTSKDLLGSLLIIDEVHHLVALAKSESKATRVQFAKLYHDLSAASRILALSGTPIFTELSDLAYVINLVSGQEILPYNNREFTDDYTTIAKTRSLWRGHVTESHLLIFGLPFVLAAVPLAFITPTVGVISGVYFGGIGLGFLSFPLINASVPLNRFPLRSFNSEKLKGIASQYVSFFDFRMDSKQEELYAKKRMHDQSIPYNQQQIEFFLNFADRSLGQDDVRRLLQESSYRIGDVTAIESTAVQNEVGSIPLAGREIGNFSFKNTDGTITESPKFEAIYRHMKDEPGGVVIYSNYYENGILLFHEFLKRKGVHQGVAILHQNAPITEQIDIIARYNRGDIKILLLHPAFTEGISLEMTRQLHILEPLGSQARYEQVIGRVIRLNAHAQLDKSLRVVDIYEWASSLSGLNAFLAKNNNWALRFSELNSIASFGTGQAEIDPHHFQKSLSPDELARERRHIMSNAMTTLRELFSNYSIERGI